MNGREYDEYQLQQRQKIAMQTLLLTLVLILADGIVRTGWGEWAEPMMEALLLIVLPALYFLTLAICKNAYFGRSGSWLSWVYLALGALFGGEFLFSWAAGRVAFVKDGLLSISIQPLVMGVFFCYIAGLSLIRRGIERRREQREE
ncbi:hypothetical protein LJB68_03495 [bacterium 210820-DFI.6.52]|nr:hypothetical protein [bacterium 210820-DFI.6.52]